MEFKIEQVAIFFPESTGSTHLMLMQDLFGDAGSQWIHDSNVAEGRVLRQTNQPRGKSDYADSYKDVTVKGHLLFNYGSDIELEFLQYDGKDHWMRRFDEKNTPVVSHFGMHVSPVQLDRWRSYLTGNFGFKVAQEVRTVEHTNPAIKDERRYDYVIFDTRHVLGVDLKFIVRLDI